MYTEIKSYRIFLDEGSQKNRSFTTINLFDTADELIGVINFFEEELEVNGPKDFDHVYLQYPISKFPYIVDVLRNEKPIFVGYWKINMENTAGFVPEKNLLEKVRSMSLNSLGNPLKKGA